MGVQVHIQTNHPAIIAAVEASFGGFGPTDPNATPEITLNLFGHEFDDGPPQRPVFRTDGPLVHQSAGHHSVLVANRELGLAFGYFSPRLLADSAFFRWHFLELAFFVMLERRGIMGLHGAAVVHQGRAILLRAQSGGGKTTLAYAAVRQGFQALAEDVVWLDLTRGLWWGIPWHFHLLPDAKTLFPELAAYRPALQTNGEMKLEVNLPDLRSDSTTVSAQPGPVVLIERRPDELSRLESFDLEAAKALWLTGCAGSEMDFPDYESHIEALLSHNTYRLYFGDDIEAAVHLLETL